MSSQDIRKTKIRGRPATVAADVFVGFRMPGELVTRIEDWAGRQPEPSPKRSEAIRRLLEHALADGGPKILTPEQKIARAKRKAAIPVPEKPSPAKGVALLRKGKAEAGLAALKAKRSKPAR